MEIVSSNQYSGSHFADSTHCSPAVESIQNDSPPTVALRLVCCCHLVDSEKNALRV